MKDTLISLGLTDNEADMYLHLLAISGGTAYDVIKKSGMHRNSVYTGLQSLVKKKLVTQVEKNKKQFFQPTDPQRILMLEEAHLDRIRDLVGNLQKLYQARPTEIIVHEGLREYREFWKQIAKTSPKGTVNYVMPSMSRQWWDLMGSDAKKFLKYLAENEIRLKMIVFSKAPEEMDVLRRYPKLNEFRLIERNYDPAGNLGIWGNVCLIQSVENIPVLIEIRNDALLKVFQQHFELLWEVGKELEV
ncbi:MAG: Sugar-specific transcriptional regulator, TrmB family [Parcubacteria group bacterium GW2011_GWA2_47_8]|nr:MAG: Sugar-specific transcriptional regulator, TrmB family [Parcubacteria group bacterium GW2011_GWA2_47_8]